jgi:hypothetical protein
MLFPIDVSHLRSSMLIFLGVQTAVDVNHLLPSMLIFSLLVTGPAVFSQNNLADKISTYSVLFSLLSFRFEVERILFLFKIFMQKTLCGLFTNSSISRQYRMKWVNSLLIVQNKHFHCSTFDKIPVSESSSNLSQKTGIFRLWKPRYLNYNNLKYFLNNQIILILNRWDNPKITPNSHNSSGHYLKSIKILSCPQLFLITNLKHNVELALIFYFSNTLSDKWAKQNLCFLLLEFEEILMLEESFFSIMTDDDDHLQTFK